MALGTVIIDHDQTFSIDSIEGVNGELVIEASGLGRFIPYGLHSVLFVGADGVEWLTISAFVGEHGKPWKRRHNINLTLPLLSEWDGVIVP